MSNISSRPHIRAKKMDAWKEAAPLSGYLQWRDMQLFMNLQMKGILQHAANLSILPSSNQSQLNRLNCPDTIKGYADSDPLHDADVKFFLDGSYRTHPQSSFFSSKKTIISEPTAMNVTSDNSSSTSSNNINHNEFHTSSNSNNMNNNNNNNNNNIDDNVVKTNVNEPSPDAQTCQVEFIPEPTNNKPIILLVGSDLHISIAILYNSNLPAMVTTTCSERNNENNHNKFSSSMNNATSTKNKTTKVEFFDCRGSNISLEKIKDFFRMQVNCKTFSLINKLNFQEDGNCAGDEGLDIYCNTWIYYWVYLRIIHQISAQRIVNNIKVMNSKERLEEIDRFQCYLYDLPKQTQVGSEQLYKYSQANPFIMGTIDPKIVKLRAKLLKEASLSAFGSTHKKKKQKIHHQISNKNIINSNANTTTRDGRTRYQFVLHNKKNKKKEEKWYVKTKGSRAIEYFQVLPRSVPYRFFRHVKNDLITLITMNELIPILNIYCIETLMQSQQQQGGNNNNNNNNNTINIKDIQQNDDWVIFKIKNRVKSGKLKGIFNISCKTNSDKKKNKNLSLQLYLNRRTYGTDWTLLQPSFSIPKNVTNQVDVTLQTNIYRNEASKQVAEEEAMLELQKNQYCLPNMYTGELEEDATNIIMCDNDIQINDDTNESCPNFIHIKALGYESVSSLPDDGSFKWYCSDNCKNMVRTSSVVVGSNE